MYLTINIHKHPDLVKFGGELTLKKEPTAADMESISVYTKDRYDESVHVGYVANSVPQVILGTWSAGRAYDKLGNEEKVKVIFKKGNDIIIAQVEEDLADERTTDSISNL